MFKVLLKYGPFVLLMVFISGCEEQVVNNDKVVAEVGAKRLYLSDVSTLVPNDLPKEDSAIMADDYIRKWVRQELVLQKAEENLSAELKNVTRELEEYRNSLIIFRYKNELMAQRMDTTVTDAEILELYSQTPENFMLDRCIVKAVYMRIPADFANPDLLKEMAGNTSDEGIIEIRDYCRQYAKGFDIFTDRWVRFDRVIANIPVTIENPEQFLQQNQFIEHTDGEYYYLVALHEFKLKNEQAPVDYAQDNIKSLILNRRKIEFLREVENNIYREGVNKNNFKIYNIE
jgi:hypothetical protein